MERPVRIGPGQAFGALILAALLASSCSDPEKQKVRHVERGDRYAAEQRDDFAVVEYASAVNIDPKFGEARLKLAQTYERMGNMNAAGLEYIRAADALPDDRAAQIKATQLLLFGRRFQDAQARAAALVAKNPRDVEAILLLANAMASMRDPAGAIAEIEEALRVSPDSSRAMLTLGSVRLQTGNTKEAEAAFRSAIALDPSSIDAQLAFASFLMASERLTEAEATLKKVIGIEPKHLLANRMLAAVYLATKRPAEAEAPLKVVADASNTAAARFQLADYYVATFRPGVAASILHPLSADPATFAEAELRLAMLDRVDGKAAEGHKRLDGILAKSPNWAPALVVKAQWLTAENKFDEALAAAKAAVSADLNSAPAHFALAAVQEQRHEVADATKSYEEVLKLNPRASAAQIALSRLSLASGATEKSLQYAGSARLQDPSSLEARAVLVKGLIVKGDLARAESEIAALLKGAPDAATSHSLNGSLLATRNDAVAARRSFQRALELEPRSYDALAGLTYLDLKAKNPAAAIARLESEVSKRPADAPLLELLASAYSAAGDSGKAEQTLRRAVSADSRYVAGYTRLAELYVQQRRIDEALAEYEGIVKRDPSSIAARTMIGMLLDVQGRREDAIKAYEAAAVRPESAPVAANNLAFIYAELGRNLDVALQLATTAKQQLPNEPSVDDTLGWVYYKKDMPSLAVKALEESRKQLPDNAELLYHLGLTYAKLGEKQKAQEALSRALRIDPNIGGDQSRQVLASVSK
jgi:tetratricopeptide (TPR) repeat protein